MSPERRKSRHYLPELVSLEIMTQSGFNFYEPSLGLKTKLGLAKAYVSEPYPSTGGKNVVIIERSEPDGHKWYFGYFEGKAMSERETEEESNEYLANVWQFLDESHQIPINELESRINALLITERDS